MYTGSVDIILLDLRMKARNLIIGLCFLLLSAVAVWAECELIRFFGGPASFFAIMSTSLGLVGVLIRSPEGEERPDGFHVRPGHRPTQQTWSPSTYHPVGKFRHVAPF
jgi:hypothetical protein